MCGIVGYTGGRPATPILINGLRRLEYRGYDSAGLALQLNGELAVCKRKGKVSELSKALQDEAISTTASNATLGIAHTRWATHGPPTEANAHPHCGTDSRVALVHNGIVENHSALKQGLVEGGATFRSDTDSEVLAHLVERALKDSLLDAILQSLPEVEGTYGIACVSRDEPGVIVAARRGSPIVIGLGDDETIVASDATAVVGHTRQVIYLNDGEVARIEGGRIDIRTLSNSPVTRSPLEIDWSDNAVEKGGYEHFMLKEIHEQPDAVRNTLRGRIDLDRASTTLGGLELSARELAEIRRVVFVGCGSSLHSGMIGAHAMEELAGIPAAVEQAAEFRYRNPIIGPHDLIVAISQSGETADTLAALREAQERGARVIGVVNSVGSTIAREAGRGIYLHAGPEISVASTKAFTCQVTAVLMLALKLGRARRLGREQSLELAKGLQQLPDWIAEVTGRGDSIAALADHFKGIDHAFFIGRGYHQATAFEGALKLKEISYLHAEGYHAAELKHGPIALLEESVPVVAIAANDPGRDKMLSNIAECRARSAPVIGIFHEGDDEAASQVDGAIHIPRCPPAISTIPASVALQILAYHVADQRGCPIDQPRNLAKSVTVE